MSTAGRWTGYVLAIAGFAATLAYIGPALDDHSPAVADAIAQQQAQVRFEKAAREICGPNAAVLDLGYGAIQCRTRKGKKTVTARVPQ
jgi:hypothetical protein